MLNKNLSTLKIKFHIIPHNYYNKEYQHESVVLAEGFRDMGLTFFGTTDYWFEPENNCFLIKKTSENLKADINIYNQYYLIFFPDEINKIDYTAYNLLIDIEDTLYTSFSNKLYNKFDLLLTAHFNRNIKYRYYHKNVKPWYFGLSKRIIDTIDKSSDLQVKPQILITYRVDHSLRENVKNYLNHGLSKLYPIITTNTSISYKNNTNLDLFYNKQTNNRHDLEYYKCLNSSLLTYAFGGKYEIKPFATNRLNRKIKHFYRIKSTFLNSINKNRYSCYFVYQYDSWRLWESFYSNTCPLHLDFEEQGWLLPENPINGVHYLGIKNHNFDEFAEKIGKMDIEEIKQIGQQGKQWVINNYSPRKSAERLLNTIFNT
jgi:hypothetical protein